MTQVRQSPQTVQNVVTFDIVVSVDNTGLALKPGLTAATRIVTDERRGVLRVPDLAFRYRPAGSEAAGAAPQQAGEAVLWMLRNGQPIPVSVKVGLDDDSFTEIIQAIEARRSGRDERAVIAGPFQRPAAEIVGLRLAMSEPVIRVEDISRIYRSGDVQVPALQGVSLTVMPGEFVAIMGSSGSGKSTLMSILGCLDRPESGHYFFEGLDVAQLSEPELASIRSERLGFVFQSFNLLPRTSALENVTLPLFYSASGLGRETRNKRGRAALELLGLAQRERNTPGQLSGGQQQRVAIARALINAPSLLLADEPTGNLDTRTSHEIMETLVSLNREQGVTIVVVTHESDIAAYASRVITMRDGRSC